jgi:hypothetical protein
MPPGAGLWSTRDMNPADDREIIVKTTIRELVVYCAFLTVLCICKLSQNFEISHLFIRSLSLRSHHLHCHAT